MPELKLSVVSLRYTGWALNLEASLPVQAPVAPARKAPAIAIYDDSVREPGDNPSATGP